ncbi:arsenosugar biosynthesis radical SAM (seleno)protein ArsS [Leptospira yasudae]|uniref:Radical SAM/Cys-rich domain protein n=1 Tax=Leptospira yasudae TaxID=2202201 RepID=A0A6N4QEU8_9LEPT|nr:arsenosugar biosynthesis radical SAM (seleno)protein ArsS [Leptospira yasudae]TGL75340.1 radical SAM/Cys-rich domain protein [Leptospira yasudae]TGL77586.1 radical SAM/Cys-rich domain protein [Leptospira yasudae]TGL79230.1 radical SAM/Cys-rich domain protein [Leptospira yasudae]
MKSLQSRGSELVSPERQFEILEEVFQRKNLPSFTDRLIESGVGELHPVPTEIFQMNLGKLCNQTCKHCHVDAGPDRKEIMSKETMLHCLSVLAVSPISTVDITGGAPEMNPEFRWLVTELRRLGKKIMVRCNLTILLAGERYKDLPQFYADQKVEVVSSLPYFEKRRTDAQRGDGVFDRSIEALKRLNAVGYGDPDSGLVLNLVYNPAGAFLPGGQATLEREFKISLQKQFGIRFNSLFTITNMPISRYLEYLIESGNLDGYMEKLVTSFNPIAAQGVMCRNTLSVGCDGTLYDCDFNQMLDMKLEGSAQNIRDYDAGVLEKRKIRVHEHCYGCTAGAGSSCGGATA